MDERQLDLMYQYLDLILEANKTTNLTRITDHDEAKLLHIEDSLVGLPEVDDAPAGMYGDLGSGGGFPGVPLALASGRQTLLIDSVKKKMTLVQQVLDELGLSAQISTFDGRIEILGQQQPRSFAVLTARALSRLVALLELSSPLLIKGGRLVCYKAQVAEDELKEARAVESLLGMRLVSCRDTILSDDETRRTILVFEKVGKAQLNLPRRVGWAQKSPLKPRR